MNFLQRYFPLQGGLQDRLRKFFGREKKFYPCLTCLLPDAGDAVDDGLNNPFRNRRKGGIRPLGKET